MRGIKLRYLMIMRITRNSDTLDFVWNNLAYPVNVKLLNGVWRVEVLTGLLPDLSLLKHRKLFVDVNGSIAGSNLITIAGKDRVWGKFTVLRCTKTVALVYDNNVIVDYIKQLTPEIMLGEFCYKERFISYFTLLKEKNSQLPPP